MVQRCRSAQRCHRSDVIHKVPFATQRSGLGKRPAPIISPLPDITAAAHEWAELFRVHRMRLAGLKCGGQAATERLSTSISQDGSSHAMEGEAINADEPQAG